MDWKNLQISAAAQPDPEDDNPSGQFCQCSKEMTKGEAKNGDICSECYLKLTEES